MGGSASGPMLMFMWPGSQPNPGTLSVVRFMRLASKSWKAAVDQCQMWSIHSPRMLEKYTAPSSQRTRDILSELMPSDSPSAGSAAGEEPLASACQGISFQMPWLSAAPHRRRSGGVSGSALISCIHFSGSSYASGGRLGRLCLHSYVRRYARWSGHHVVGSCEP